MFNVGGLDANYEQKTKQPVEWGHDDGLIVKQHYFHSPQE